MKLVKFTFLLLSIFSSLSLQASRDRKSSEDSSHDSSFESCSNTLHFAREFRRKSNILIENHNRSERRPDKIRFLEEAINLCSQAARSYSDILEAIDGKRHNSASTAWRSDMKKVCSQELNDTNQQIGNLYDALRQLKAVEEIDRLLESCMKIKQKADELKAEIVISSLSDSPKAIDAINEAARLYSLAVAQANTAIGLCLNDQNRDVCQTNLNHFKNSSEECRKKADSWRSKAQAKKEEMLEEIGRLNAERGGYVQVIDMIIKAT